MENYNFSPKYIKHMKDALKEEFCIIDVEEKTFSDNKDLLEFLKE